MTNFGDYQDEIYLAGLSGHTPRFPFRFEELEARAHAAMSPSLASYVVGGSAFASDSGLTPLLAVGPIVDPGEGV